MVVSYQKAGSQHHQMTFDRKIKSKNVWSEDRTDMKHRTKMTKLELLNSQPFTKHESNDLKITKQVLMLLHRSAKFKRTVHQRMLSRMVCLQTSKECSNNVSTLKNCVTGSNAHQKCIPLVCLGKSAFKAFWWK